MTEWPPPGTFHVRESTEHGPDYCRECSEQADDWVPWPCPPIVTSGVPAAAALSSVILADSG